MDIPHNVIDDSRSHDVTADLRNSANVSSMPSKLLSRVSRRRWGSRLLDRVLAKGKEFDGELGRRISYHKKNAVHHDEDAMEVNDF